MTEYVAYESVVWELPTEPGVCGWCGMADDCLSTRDPVSHTSCRWCRELHNLRHHRWGQAAAMHRPHRWMVRWDARPDSRHRVPIRLEHRVMLPSGLPNPTQPSRR